MGCCIGKLRKSRSERKVTNASVDKAVITESPVLCQPDVEDSSSYLAYSTKSCIRSPPPLSLKDRTFSNEFLVSCLKDNPQVVTTRLPDQLAFEFRTLGRKTPQRLEWQRSTSPVPMHQDTHTTKYYSSTRKASQLRRSPSPSRRFNNNSTKPVSNCRHKKAQLPPFTDRATSSTRRRCSAYLPDLPGANRIVSSSSALIGEMECMTLEEDLDNPLISLDCFIFL